MKIGIAQIQSVKGQIADNIALHQEAIALAARHKVQAIFFSELSLTGYEPSLANELKIEPSDKRLDVFQEISDAANIMIGLGVPTQFGEQVRISMLLFQPNQARQVYSKQLLHEDELPYFVNGDTQLLLPLNGMKIAPAICYESLQKQHLENALAKGATLYVASVAKSQKGMDKATAYFPAIAKEKNIPILMANSIGYCDNFESVGQSAVWNKEGQLIGQLSNKEAAVLMYDTIADTTAAVKIPQITK